MRKLADVVTSLWLGNIALPKELFNVLSLHGNILLLGMMNNVKARNPEAYQDIIIGTLYKQFARENRATRSKETIFSELDKLEALETEYYETSGHVPKWLTQELKIAGEDVEFENYVTLLKEARAQFGREMECAVILYINKHKGEHYCLGCMGRRDKP